jgi:riboflavin transporter FmnP
MQKINQSSSTNIKKIATAALFAAIAYVAMFVTSWIKVGFLTFDAKDTVITLAGLLFGPLYALSISLVVATIELITVGDTGFYGFFMNVLSSAVFSTVCALIYKYKKNIKGAITGLIASIFSMTATMLLFNLFITPLYMHVDRSVVAQMIPTLFMPFNLTKGTLNAALVLTLYKPISHALKAVNILPKSTSDHTDKEAKREKKRKNLIFSLVVTAVGIVTVILCAVVFFVFLDGQFAINCQ